MQKKLLFSMLALAMAAAAVLAPATMQKASAASKVPCYSIGSGRYMCSWWERTRTRFGTGTPVMAYMPRTSDSSAYTPIVDYLHPGKNWITCQAKGASMAEGRYYNNWYAYTLGDNGHWGWVSALGAVGGSNYQGFANVPLCNGSHGPAR